MVTGYYLAPCKCGAMQANLHLGRNGDGHFIRCGLCGRRGNPGYNEYFAAFEWNELSRDYLQVKDHPLLAKHGYKDPYFIVSNEWLYPCESGHEVVDEYTVWEQALNKAMLACNEELKNYSETCGCDPLQPAAVMSENGLPEKFIITAKNGLDEWWFASRIIPVEYGA